MRKGLMFKICLEIFVGLLLLVRTIFDDKGVTIVKAWQCMKIFKAVRLSIFVQNTAQPYSALLTFRVDRSAA